MDKEIIKRCGEKFNGQVIMRENEKINEHQKHKPYKCDFGSVKNEEKILR